MLKVLPFSRRSQVEIPNSKWQTAHQATFKHALFALLDNLVCNFNLEKLSWFLERNVLSYNVCDVEFSTDSSVSTLTIGSLHNLWATKWSSSSCDLILILSLATFSSLSVAILVARLLFMFASNTSCWKLISVGVTLTLMTLSSLLFLHFYSYFF